MNTTIHQFISNGNSSAIKTGGKDKSEAIKIPAAFIDQQTDNKVKQQLLDVSSIVSVPITPTFTSKKIGQGLTACKGN